MKLTKSRIDALEPNGVDRFVWDDDIKGFGLRVSPKGKKTYVLQYRNSGRTQRIRIGHANSITVHQARQDCKVLLGDIAFGKSPAKHARKVRNAPTVKEAAEKFLKEYAEVRLKKSTVSDYGHVIRGNIIPHLGSRKVSEITYNEIADLHHKLKATPTQANRTVSVLSKILNMCQRWGYRDGAANPCSQIQRYKEQRRNRFLSKEELGRLWNVLETAQQKRLTSAYAVAAYKLLILTGCRLGEIRTLKWSYITGNRVEFPDSKTGYKRLPLNADAMNVLRQIPQLPDNEYVICGDVPGQPIINLQKSWRRLRAEADLDDVRIHDLRHTFASHAVMGGTPLAIVSKLLGHSQIATTMRYAHLADEELAEAAESIGSILNSNHPVPETKTVLKLVR